MVDGVAVTELPVEEDRVALGDHEYEDPPEAVSDCDPPGEIVAELGLTDTDGCPFTVIIWVSVQPLLLVYEIDTVPPEIPVTVPVLLTFATEVFDELQGLLLAAVPLPVSHSVAY